ncbi:type II secretion system protein [Cerasicoccus fimbriatus]|uniref:type II secretion system protein n=1 Tax=Cerasicoccus fimbriatus TaxID=3014554 RepID=UPI0022B4577E|nr:prepilin-type N-terminal cleavage/methylation domain-containing protein [Cerasicoccus sp. TK19100]
MPQIKEVKQGFTLVELLTVVAIIAILGAILIPVVGNIKHSAHNTKCASNLRQLGLATISYVQENESTLPQLDYTFVETLFPYIYPNRADSVPEIKSGEAFPEGLMNTVFECPSMDHDVINARGYAINDRLAYIQIVETDNGNKPNKWNLPISIIENPALTAIFSDTYTTSSMTAAMLPTQVQSLERHDHNNVVFLDGHVEEIMPDDPRVEEIHGPFWKGKRAY